MMKTLDWYLGRSIIQTTGFALMVLVGISTLIKFIEQLKSTISFLTGIESGSAGDGEEDFIPFI